MSGGEGENSIPLLLLRAKKVRWVPAGQKEVCPAVTYPFPLPKKTFLFLHAQEDWPQTLKVTFREAHIL